MDDFNSDDELTPLPAPRKGDRLVRDDLPDGKSNACVNVMKAGDSIAYIEGYRRGAARLVLYVLEEQRDQDYLVYPIISLYRHHIELALKRIITRAPYLLGRVLTDIEKKHLRDHCLDKLWGDLKPLLAGIAEAAGWDPLNSADVEGVDEYILQLSQIDPRSFSFRYDKSKTGDPSLPSDLKIINLRHFAEMMERLSAYIESIDMATAHLLEAKSEMEAAWKENIVQYLDYSCEPDE